MTIETIEYLLRLSAVWLALLLFYRWAAPGWAFALRRGYLWFTAAAGALIPLLSFAALADAGQLSGLPTLPTALTLTKTVTGSPPAGAVTGGTPGSVLPWLYGAGVLLMGARTLVQWFRLEQWWRSGTRSRYAGYPVVRHRAVSGPFVVWGRIYLPAHLPDAALTRTALIHEAAHLRRRHHYDTFFLTLGSCLLWCHPLWWWLRHELAAVHEYEADAAVVRRVPARRYGLQLLQSSLGPAGYPGLFSSPLKLRITMITQPTPRRSPQALPLLVFSLLLAALVVACSDASEAIPTPSIQTIEETEWGNIVITEDAGETMTVAGEPTNIVAVVESARDLPHKLVKHIYREISYPEAALASGTEATLFGVLKIDDEGRSSTEALYFPTVAQLADPADVERLEIVVVGLAEAAAAGRPRPELLKREVDRTFRTVRDLSIAKADGATATSLSVPLKITFIIER